MALSTDAKTRLGSVGYLGDRTAREVGQIHYIDLTDSGPLCPSGIN